MLRVDALKKSQGVGFFSSAFFDEARKKNRTLGFFTRSFNFVSAL